MTIVYFIRHNEPKQSTKDGVKEDLRRALTPRGLEQVARVTEFLKDKGISAIYSSDARRTQETIREFACHSGLAMQTDARLREGVLGCPREENPIHSQRQWEDHSYCLPEGESLRQVQERMWQCVREILEKNRGQRVAICTHGTAMCTMINLFCPEFGWEEARAVKQVWPWILRFDFDDGDRFIQYKECVR